jgi:hypothetical protein
MKGDVPMGGHSPFLSLDRVTRSRRDKGDQEGIATDEIA